MKDGIIFYRSFLDAAERLDAETYKEATLALLRYGIYGEEPDELSPLARMFFVMARAQVDANSERRANGTKGGRPRKKTETGTESGNKKPVVFKCETSGFETENQWLPSEKPKEKEKEKEKDKGKVKEKGKGNEETAQDAPAPASAQKTDLQKKTYGEFGNVRLTEAERQRLDERLGEHNAAEYIERLGEYLKSKGKRYSSHYATILAWHRRDGTGGGGRRNTDTGAAPEPEAAEGFDAFWVAYPKHSGIDDAKREWAALAPDDELRERILRAVAWRKGTEPWKEQQGKFVPAPAKWLHDHGWTDYKPPQRSGAVYEGMGPREPDVEENWDAIMGEQIRAIRGY